MHGVAGWLAALSPTTLHLLFGLVLAAAAAFGRSTNLESSGLALVWPAAGIAFLWSLWASRSRVDFTVSLIGAFPILAAAILNGSRWRLPAGIITDRTIHVYAAWVDRQMLEAEGDTMVGDAIAAEGIEYLREINRKRRVIGQKVAAM